ncbi:MAG: hypothetical protein LBR90_04540 [Elusimicrobiota bacterium]|jgi:hypothetical protein|nr:hypothetical protein [Elusimicrobiota bacterium]
MKIQIIVLTSLILFAACSSAHKEQYQQAKEQAETFEQKVQLPNIATYDAAVEEAAACQKDSDCIAVPAGCCQCDGQTAANKSAQTRLAGLKSEVCQNRVCTMQMCLTAVEVTCEQNRCKAVKKANQGFF